MRLILLIVQPYTSQQPASRIKVCFSLCPSGVHLLGENLVRKKTNRSFSSSGTSGIVLSSSGSTQYVLYPKYDCLAKEPFNPLWVFDHKFQISGLLNMSFGVYSVIKLYSTVYRCLKLTFLWFFICSRKP